LRPDEPAKKNRKTKQRGKQNSDNKTARFKANQTLRWHKESWASFPIEFKSKISRIHGETLDLERSRVEIE